MQLSNEEFARLERARTTMDRTKDRNKVSPLQLAFEHMEYMYQQQQKLLTVNQRLHQLYGASWCYKVRRAYSLTLHWFVRKWTGLKNRVKPTAS